MISLDTDGKTIDQVTDGKQTVSARVNSHIVDIYKADGIPLSLVIENSLVSFLRLPEPEKIKFLSQNMPEEVKADELKPISKNWKELFSDYLAKANVPSSVSTKLLSGLCIGAVGLVGGLLLAFGENFLKKKDE